jgi:hypothetical protein
VYDDFDLAGTEAEWFNMDGTVEWSAGGRNASPGAVSVCQQTDTGFNEFRSAPGSLPDPLPGDGVHVVAWARAASGQPTQPAKIRLRELASDDSTLKTYNGGSVSLDESWRELRLDATFASADLAHMEIGIITSGTSPADCFQVDDICLDLSGSAQGGGG